LLERVVALRRTLAFGELSDATLLALVPLLDEHHVQAGEEVVREGERGRSLYVVVDGSLEVARAGAAIARLGKGDIFGELALLASEPRAATVRALGDCLLLELDQDVFFDLLEADVEALRGFIKVLIDRIR
jgi:CRP-like cAMP-binding protein